MNGNKIRDQDSNNKQKKKDINQGTKLNEE